ncbi:MAG: porin [Ewingella americana]|jgi:predicted porin|uniref:Outer membrane protein F n=2 Tax=Ewingella americana TaxID=41202 RepID=A0A2N0MVY1_9GAMM|nr:porin [Ewingella americana]KAA8728126.1 porin [Ewingella americana]KFC85696.1 putative outer membrane protein [Ewingella americana ATCC 33852]MCI1680860.1 porin [Ewingella americana]MCI1855334.1 porin [Ewingella americana]MCI1862193.1 porin [Ewingella americana]
MSKFIKPMIIGGVVLSVLSASAQAEITVLEKNKQSDALLAPLSVKVGGSIRPEWIFNNGPEPGYYKNGHDGGTRFRFSTDYALSQDTSIIGYYELGVDLAHALSWDDHYNEDGRRDKQRQLYAGIKDDRYGTFTYGHQYGIYYSVVGIKSDVWDNDGHAGATGIGVNGDFDGANKPKNSLKYTNDFGPVTLYANYLLPEDQTTAGGNLDYRRNNGAGIGADYKITKDLVFSAAYSANNATIKETPENEKDYHQEISGTALTWQPNNWYIVGTASYYKNFVPSTHEQSVDRYFAGSGYGVEGFVGYTFNIDQPFLKSIQPYVAADSLQLKGDEDYHQNNVYFGAGTVIGHGLSVYVERTLATSTNNEVPDSTWVTVFYDF